MQRDCLLGSHRLVELAGPEHLAALSQGKEAWNDWHVLNPDAKPRLTSINFDG